MQMHNVKIHKRKWDGKAEITSLTLSSFESFHNSETNDIYWAQYNLVLAMELGLALSSSLDPQHQLPKLQYYHFRTRQMNYYFPLHVCGQQPIFRARLTDLSPIHWTKRTNRMSIFRLPLSVGITFQRNDREVR